MFFIFFNANKSQCKYQCFSCTQEKQNSYPKQGHLSFIVPGDSRYWCFVSCSHGFLCSDPPWSRYSVSGVALVSGSLEPLNVQVFPSVLFQEPAQLSAGSERLGSRGWRRKKLWLVGGNRSQWHLSLPEWRQIFLKTKTVDTWEVSAVI